MGTHGRLFAALGAGSMLWLLGSALAAQSSPAQDAPPATASDEASFRVIVHADNPTVEIEAVKVSRMFRKKVKRWDHDVLVLPIDLDARSPIRKAFTKSVHGKSVTAIKSFWQRMIFSGRDVPPEEKSSEQEVLEYVRGNPGAIGYVAADTAFGNGAKELKITP